LNLGKKPFNYFLDQFRVKVLKEINYLQVWPNSHSILPLSPRQTPSSWCPAPTDECGRRSTI
jgi:hypothetical protein